MDTILNEGDGLEEARRMWSERLPMGRMGNPEELCGAVVLLSSKVAGRYMTGADIVVDGEYPMPRRLPLRCANKSIGGISVF